MNRNEGAVESPEVQNAVMELLMETGRCDTQPALTASLSSLGMDSLKLVEIIFALETRFSIIADEELMAELETVGDLVVLIDRACMLRRSQEA